MVKKWTSTAQSYGSSSKTSTRSLNFSMIYMFFNVTGTETETRLGISNPSCTRRVFLQLVDDNVALITAPRWDVTFPSAYGRRSWHEHFQKNLWWSSSRDYLLHADNLILDFPQKPTFHRSGIHKQQLRTQIA